MNYELYHDESQEGGYWHGMLLIPIDNKHEIVNLLQESRESTQYFDPLSIKKIKEHNRVFDCAFAWICIGIGFMRSQTKSESYYIPLGLDKKRRRLYKELSIQNIGAKFILFRERDYHQQMIGYQDYGSKIETTLRMGIKGGLHFLGNDVQPIHIDKMHFDGFEHYERHIDQSRVVGRLRDLRQYCSIANRDDLIDDRGSDHRKQDAQTYDDCQLLQLTDLIIGSFRTSLGYQTRAIHSKFVYPIKKLVKKYHQGYARMRNSRWFNSFCMSQCYLKNGI